MTANALPQDLAARAEWIVNSLQQTDYQHTEFIDADAGIYDCDCSGFVGYVLQQLAPAHYRELPKESTQPRPRAFEYYNFFSSLGTSPNEGWQRVEKMMDARRGDIVTWRFPEIEAGHDTGHVLFLAETPVLNVSGVAIVRVYDAANTAHFEDTRGPRDDQFPNGVGSGFINFRLDAHGKPVAFQFAPADVFVTLPIAIGRAMPLHAPA